VSAYANGGTLVSRWGHGLPVHEMAAEASFPTLSSAGCSSRKYSVLAQKQQAQKLH